MAKRDSAFLGGASGRESTPSIKRERGPSFAHSIMHLVLSIDIEHALLLSKVCKCCLAHRVSSSGDPNLSPGGLRVPARGRSSIIGFSGESHSIYNRDCTLAWEAQFLEEVVSGVEIYQGIQLGIVRGDQPLAIPAFCQRRRPSFAMTSSGPAHFTGIA